MPLVYMLYILTNLITLVYDCKNPFLMPFNLIIIGKIDTAIGKTLMLPRWNLVQEK
jgi:hypothetical protein